MIPLGLKETKELEVEEVFRELIESHYYEDGADYDEALAELADLRQAMRTPTRDKNGTALLFQYYNQLYFVERRFFPPDRSSGLFFEWWVHEQFPAGIIKVSNSGTTLSRGFHALRRLWPLRELRCSSTLGGSTHRCGLFRLPFLTVVLHRWGQDTIGAQQRGLRMLWTTSLGLQAPSRYTLLKILRHQPKCLQYILENFSHAPSRDLEPATLHMLVQLMCGQVVCLDLHPTYSDHLNPGTRVSL